MDTSTDIYILTYIFRYVYIRKFIYEKKNYILMHTPTYMRIYIAENLFICACLWVCLWVPTVCMFLSNFGVEILGGLAAYVKKIT